jgi:hypothetical protein
MAASNSEMAPLRSGSFRSTVMEWIRFHRVNIWIFCYELGFSVQANAALYRGIKARRASTELDEEIQRCFSRA